MNVTHSERRTILEAIEKADRCYFKSKHIDHGLDNARAGVVMSDLAEIGVLERFSPGGRNGSSYRVSGT